MHVKHSRREATSAFRAQCIRGRMALEGLYLPTHASWLADFRSELLSFPTGKHDDMVDALGLVGQLLDRMNAGPKAKLAGKEKPKDDYKPREPKFDNNVMMM